MSFYIPDFGRGEQISISPPVAQSIPDPRSLTLISGPGMRAPVVAKMSIPAATQDKNVSDLDADIVGYEDPWMDRELISGVKNKWLVYGGGGAVVLLGVYMVMKKKKASVAGYRRRSRR